METGFAVIPGVLSAGECEELLSVPALTRASRAGTRHLMRHSAIAAVALRLAPLAGESFVPFRATFFDKSPQSNWLVPWHQDTALPLTTRGEAPGWGPWSLKDGIHYAHAPAWALERVVALRLHLDESAEDNGPLRVIPGSHRLGVLTDDEVTQYASHAQSELCLVPQGGVLMMKPLLIHASAKLRSERPRRVVHIEYANAWELAPGLRLASA